MARYTVTLNVVQQVARKLKLEIDAEDEEDAHVIAANAAAEYPRAIFTNTVHRMVSIRDEFSPPTEIQVEQIREDKRFG